MFNATPDEQRHCANEMNRFVQEGQLKPSIGRIFPLDEAVEAEKFLEANTMKGAGTLTGKVVITI